MTDCAVCVCVCVFVFGRQRWNVLSLFVVRGSETGVLFSLLLRAEQAPLPVVCDYQASIGAHL